MAGHVDFFRGPGGFVGGVGAEAGPDGVGESVGGFAGEALGDFDVAVLEPEVFLRFG